MGGAAPMTILTDQCAAMAKAIKSTLINTKHRWCRWHVLKKAKKKLGKVYSKHKRFKHEFNTLITDEINITKFEETWLKLLKKYRLVKNKYLKRLYKHREKWAKPYFMDIFCAGMTSTQRSESANHMLKRFIPRAAPMHLFVSKFSEFQSGRNDQEGKEQHFTYQVSRKLRVGVPIEKHATIIYTRAMYERFYNELFESGAFVIAEKVGNNEFKLVDTNDDGMVGARHISVRMKEDGKVTCEYGLFEHMGMLCKHALKVLVHLDKREIPAANIMKRWTKEGGTTSREVAISNALDDHSDMMQRRMLLTRASELEKERTSVRDDKFDKAMDTMTNQWNETVLEHAMVINTVGNQESSSSRTPLKPITCPPRTIFGGRPPNTGLKSWIASTKRASKENKDDPSKMAADWPEEENPPRKKTKSISDVM